MILNEGGNIFKTEPEKELIASRIATVDVEPTIKWLNSTFGFKFTKKEYLGTTGTKTDPDGTFEKNSSGDLDLNTDTRELPKEEIIAKLSAWCQKQGIPDLEIMNKGRKFEAGWIKDAGLQVHFRTPIKGNPKNGFVQTDFMLTDNPDLQRGAKRGGTAQFGGKDRAILLSSLARGRGLKFSPTNGVVDPNNGDAVVANNWDKIAEILLGKGAKEADTHTVETMLAKLKGDPNYDELIAPWKETMEKADDTVAKELADVRKELADARAQVDSLRESSEIEKALNDAQRWAIVPQLDPEEFAPVLRSLRSFDAETSGKVESILDAVAIALGEAGILKEIGSEGNAEHDDAYGQIEAMAKAMVTEGTVKSLSEGISRVATDNPELYSAYVAEMGA